MSPSYWKQEPREERSGPWGMWAPPPHPGTGRGGCAHDPALPVWIAPSLGLVDLTSGVQRKVCPWAGHVCFGPQLEINIYMEQNALTAAVKLECSCQQNKSPERSSGAQESEC